MFLKGTFNNEYIKQVKRESHLTASKDDHKMQCILEALQVQIHKSKKQANTNNSSLELFIDTIEKEIFNPKIIRKTHNNFKKDEKAALKEMKSWEDKVIRVQDKGSRIVVLNTSDYVEKVEH